MIYNEIIKQVKCFSFSDYINKYNLLLSQSKLRATMIAHNSENVCSTKDVKAAKTLSMIVVCFVICWLPIMTCFYIFAIRKDRHFNETVMNLCVVISHFNSGNSNKFELI